MGSCFVLNCVVKHAISGVAAAWSTQGPIVDATRHDAVRSRYFCTYVHSSKHWLVDRCGEEVAWRMAAISMPSAAVPTHSITHIDVVWLGILAALPDLPVAW